jgi:nucleoside-diphosphate kinase
MALQEKTLLIIKNEAVARGLVGKIIEKLEDAGLILERMELLRPTLAQAEAHYNKGRDIQWLENVGKKAMSLHQNVMSLLKYFRAETPIEIGKIIYKWSVKQLTGKKVVVIVVRGGSAVAKVKALVGSTIPSESDLSTIRGQFSSDSIESSNANKRAIHNVVHRSTSKAEAKREIEVWFPKSKI